MRDRKNISALYAGGLVVALAFASSARAQPNCNVGIDFHDDGPMRGCVLNGYHRIYTESGVAVTCADGKRLELHRDGTLERCTLAEPATLDARACVAGSEAVFAPDGRLLHCKVKPPG